MDSDPKKQTAWDAQSCLMLMVFVAPVILTLCLVLSFVLFILSLQNAAPMP